MSRLEFALPAVDFLARSGHNQKTTMTLKVPPERLDSLRWKGVRRVSTLEVPPGHSTLRVAAHGVETRQTGSVFLDIDVPKLEDERPGLAASR